MGKKSKKSHKSERESYDEKPLRLVLKVGSSVVSSKDNVSDASENEQKHKHKKKKRKHRHEHKEQEHREYERKERSRVIKEEIEATEEEDEDEDEDEERSTTPPPPKRLLTALKVDDDFDEKIVPRSRRERKIANLDEPSPVIACLEYIHKLLLRKDSNGFFAYPVTDNIAPMYSKIIKQPMDFSTMKSKLDNHEYSTVPEYRSDFKLMCENCMTYNLPDTIFYKEAQKLLMSGLKLMSREKLAQLKRSLPGLSSITDSELGLDHPDEEYDVEHDMEEQLHSPATSKHSPYQVEEVDDALSAEDIAAQAQAAAAHAAHQLTLRHPHSTFGFLRKREDGSTSFTVLNPDNDGIVSEKERVVSIGSLVGKLKQGTPFLNSFREDRRNKATPVTYLQYGPFSSYAPVYDSTTANLSKEDSDLLLTTYGDEAGLQYAKSLQHFVADAGDYSVRMVDNLLDILTGGDHSKAAAIIEERKQEEERKKREEEEEKRRLTEEAEQQQKSADVDYNWLRSLTSEGIDMSFLDVFEERQQAGDQMTARLGATSSLLNQLQTAQNTRLSNPPPVKPIPQTEANLASKVSGNLVELVKEVTPGDVVSIQSLRKAMGVAYTAPSQSNPQLAQSSANQQRAMEIPQTNGSQTTMQPDEVITIED